MTSAAPLSPLFTSATGKALLTTGELETCIDRLTDLFWAQRIGPGDIVAAELPNSPAYVAALSAAWRLGAAFAPVNPALGIREKARLYALARPRVIVAAEATTAGYPVIAWQRPFVAETEFDHIVGDRSFEPVVESTDRLLLFTSGSTGDPKAVVLTEANVEAGIAAVTEHYELSEDDRTIAMLPWSHGHGLFAVLLSSMRTGGSVVLPTASEALRARVLVESVRPTWLSVVPPQLALLAGGSTVSSSRLRFIRTASAPLPAALAARAEEQWKCPVTQALGLTETSHQAAADAPGWDRVRGSVGESTGFEFRVSGPELIGGQELEIRGPGVFDRYLGDPVTTAAAKTPDGWFRTRDIARRDDDGRWQLLGRISEIVNRGGYKIAPAEVEAVLCEHPLIDAALVTGVDHEVLGQELAAVIRLRDGVVLTVGDVVRHCRGLLADYKVPGRIEFVETLPQLPNGKPSRRLAAQVFQ